MKLPYDMGNAGDLLKHGVLAEFVRWQCGLGIPLRFMDPFGGEPWGHPVPEVMRRLRALTPSALHAVQSDIDGGRYYGSGLLVRRAALAAGDRSVQVLSGDSCAARRERLRACGFAMLTDVLPGFGIASGDDRHDGYDAFEAIARVAVEGDLALIDPFFDNFVGQRARTVVPQIHRNTNRTCSCVVVSASSIHVFMRSMRRSLSSRKRWSVARMVGMTPATDPFLSLTSAWLTRWVERLRRRNRGPIAACDALSVAVEQLRDSRAIEYQSPNEHKEIARSFHVGELRIRCLGVRGVLWDSGRIYIGNVHEITYGQETHGNSHEPYRLGRKIAKPHMY